MAISDAALWRQVHAERDDGVATTFLVRDIEPRLDQPRIFMIQLPYPITDLSKLPDAASSRRLDTFQEQWVEPACEALGWTLVASKTEDGSFFLYLYGNGDPEALLEKLAPFDGELGFFSDVDADWSEYAALRELVEQFEAANEGHVHSDACEHGDDEVSDGVPVGIPVVDLSGESARGVSSRAPTVDLGKPRSGGAARAKTRAKPGASKSRTATPKPRAAARASASKPSAAAARKPSAAAARKPSAAAQAATPGSKRRPAAKPSRPAAKAATSRPAARTASSRPAKTATARRAAKPKPKQRTSRR